MKTLESRNSFHTRSMLSRTFSLFLSTLCLGLTAPAAWGQDLQLQGTKDRTETFSYNPNDWPMYNYNASGTRYNTAESKLRPDTVSQLQVKWTFPTDGNVNATPVVVDDQIYAGDTSGNFYALNNNGQLLWKTKVTGSVTASALVTRNRVIFGDLTGSIYGLDRQTGATVWTTRPNPHPFAAVYGSPILVGNQVVIGIASNEEGAPSSNPQYPCCSFRGSVVALNPDNGAVAWQTYMVSPDEAAEGSSGASIWSTPTYDAATDTIYVTTGNNYSDPATTTSDAIIALNAKTGNIVWQHQFLANDVGIDYNLSPDADFGDSPQVYTLPYGRKVVSAGQKNGVFDVVDAATGDLVNQQTLEPICELNIGLFADSAVANGVVFTNGVDCSLTGKLSALQSDGSRQIWNFTTPSESALSGIAVANGVVYLQTFNFLTGNDSRSFLYALDAKDGKKLAEIPISTAGISGPSVSNGNVYLGTGITFPPFIKIQGGSIVAFSLPKTGGRRWK